MFRLLSVSVPQDDPARQLFIHLGVMTVPSLFIFEVGKYVRRNLHEFSMAKTYSARRKPGLAVPVHRLKKTGRFLGVMGPKIYNKIPEEIKIAGTESAFTRRLRAHCTRKAYYSVKEFLDE